jgi:mono/diheme cytochrome c family protein
VPRVLAVILVVLLFVILGLAVFLIALQGGGRRAVAAATPSGARCAGIGLGAIVLIVYLGVGVAVPLVLLTGNHSNANAQIGGIRLTTNEKAGRELFGDHCGVCHTLAAASAAGKIGPDLDQLKPGEQIVLHTIENGCLQVPPSASSQEACLGYGVMPANVVQGKQARQVAAFVAAVAGQE